MKRSLLWILTVAMIATLTACSDVTTSGQSGSGSTGETGQQGENVLMITGRGESDERIETVSSDLQAVKLSLKDGTLYLNQEVLAVQIGLGSSGTREATPDFLVKVKPGEISGYTRILDTSNNLDAMSFFFSYVNEEKTAQAELRLVNHYMTKEQFSEANNGREPVTASDGTLMFLNSRYSNDTMDEVHIFDPNLGSISVNLSYKSGEEGCKTADDVMKLIKPFLDDFKSRFEVVSEWDSSDTSPMSYVQLDTEYFSYNVQNPEKIVLDLNIYQSDRMLFSDNTVNVIFKYANELRLNIDPEENGFDETTNVGGNAVSNKDLYDQYGKGILVPLTSAGDGTYGYDSSNILLLTEKAAIKAGTYADDGDGFTKEEIESVLNFVFEKGALKIK